MEEIVEIEKPVPPRKIRRTLAGTLAAVFFLNWAAGIFLQNYSSNEGYRLVRKKWQMLLGMKEPVDWLILGDSSANAALVPDVLEKCKGLKALNLGTIGWVVVANDAWMLETYLNRFGPPRGVIVMHGLNTWEGSLHTALSRNPLALIPLPWRFWEKLPPRLDFSLNEIFQLFQARYVPLYAQNQTLSDLIHFRFSYFRRILPMNKSGYTPHRPDPAKVEFAAGKYLERIEVRTKAPEISEINRRTLEVISGLARKYHFRVLLLQGPLHDGLAKNPDVSIYEQQMKSMLKEIVALNPPVELLPDLPVYFPKEEMESVDHLADDSARRYTQNLCSRLH